MNSTVPAAFLSYSHFDDEHDGQYITKFRELLEREVSAQTGRHDFVIFQDWRDIRWGQQWKERIEQTLDSASFLIPILSPSFFTSSECRREVEHFLEREKALARNDLILPVYYIDSPLLSDAVAAQRDSLAQLFNSRQYFDWRPLRLKSLKSQAARQAFISLVQNICKAVQIAPTPPPGPVLGLGPSQPDQASYPGTHALSTTSQSSDRDERRRALEVAPGAPHQPKEDLESKSTAPADNFIRRHSISKLMMRDNDNKWIGPQRLLLYIKDHTEQLLKIKNDKIGDSIGRYIVNSMLDYNKVKLPMNFLRRIVNLYDNGRWTDPLEFGEKERRLIAAETVRQATQSIADYWRISSKDEDKQFNDFDDGSLVRCVDELEEALSKISLKRPLKMGVSAYPEDRIYYYILSKLCGPEKNLRIEKFDTNWGTLWSQSSRSGSADFGMINEFIGLGKKKLTQSQDLNNVIYVHKGYYIFQGSTGSADHCEQSDTQSKFDFAFKQGLKEYCAAEYKEILDKIARKFGWQDRPCNERNGFQNISPTDFIKFIRGETNIYLGGSINAKLLNQIWIKGTSRRISCLCGPDDFAQGLDRVFPANRLIFSNRFIKEVGIKRSILIMEPLVELLKTCGKFLKNRAKMYKQHDASEFKQQRDASKFIHHLMAVVAPDRFDEKDKKWNFVTCADDMFELLTEDNELIPMLSRNDGMAKQHVFISYCRDNLSEVTRLRADLMGSGEPVWWDQDGILPGQNWELAIDQAIEHSYAFIACLSKEAQSRFQSGIYPELHKAVEIQRKYPPGQVFLIPVRLSKCRIPRLKLNATDWLDKLQYVDLFPQTQRQAGLQKLLKTLQTAPEHP